MNFMKYCMAIDLCKALTLYKTEITYGTIDGYDIKELEWYKNCIRGKLILSLDEEMGNARVSKFFPFNNALPE